MHREEHLAGLSVVLRRSQPGTLARSPVARRDHRLLSFAPFFFPDGKRVIFASNYLAPRGPEFDLFAIDIDGIGIFKGTIKLDASKKPRQMDMKVAEGPMFVGETSLAIYEIDGVHFIIDNSQSIYLFGMEVDWQGGLNSRGFTFNNPNASSTCGCGTSFAV